MIVSRSRQGRGQQVKFGITADSHGKDDFKKFFSVMKKWKPDFVIDLGDLDVNQRDRFSEPAYFVIGNHDVGWIKGDEIKVSGGRIGQKITKDEWVKRTRMPNRYYSFDVKGFHFIVLDGNNVCREPKGVDGIGGVYCIDDTQKKWVSEDLARNREKFKIVFCHEELYYSDKLPPAGKEISFIDNGWELRKMFEEDGRVLACFCGHKHVLRKLLFGNTVYFLTPKYLKVVIGYEVYARPGIGDCGQSVRINTQWACSGYIERVFDNLRNWKQRFTRVGSKK